MLGAHPEEIIFTSCGTESDNTAIRSALATNPGKRHIVTTRVEHPAIQALVAHLAQEGYRVTEIPVDGEGRLNLEHYARSLTPDTAVVSAMWANNETGVIFPVEDMAVMARHKGILFHTDAVQAVGKIPIDMRQSAVDMLSLSGHKLHAPKGVGALFVRKGTRFSPFLIGGHQEKGRRGGTENVPSLIGLGEAAALAGQNLEQENTAVKSLRDKLENALLSLIAQQPGERRPARRACPTPATSALNLWRGRPSCSGSTNSASAPLRAPPAPRGRCNPPMCCAPWASPSPWPTAPSAFP